jgi:hypothetical protein
MVKLVVLASLKLYIPPPPSSPPGDLRKIIFKENINTKTNFEYEE